MSTFKNSWFKLLDHKHLVWKKNKTQSPTNQILKNEIREKKIKNKKNNN
jgi:hypothetical protein